MYWKVQGQNQASGKAWQVVILARDPADAQTQARKLTRHSVERIEAIEDVADPSMGSSRLNEIIRVLVLPMIFVALTVKVALLIASVLRGMIISE